MHLTELEVYLQKKVEAELRKMSELKGQLNIKDVEANSYQHAICVLRRFAHEDEEKMKQTQEELLQRVEEVNDLQTLNQHLIVKERATNDESTEARKELIVVSLSLFPLQIGIFRNVAMLYIL